MKFSFRYLVSGVLLSLLSSSSLAGQKFINLDDEFGIGYVEIVLQDSYGLLWIASRNGLYSFDGYSIEHFVNEPTDSTTLPDNNVISVGEDSHGNIIVSLGSKGLALLDRNTLKFRMLCPTGKGFDCDDGIAYLMTVLDDDGYLWAGTNKGLIRMNDEFEILDLYRYSREDPTSLFNDYVLDIFIDDKSRVWVGTSEGLNRLNPDSKSFTNPRNNQQYPKNQILDIQQSPEGIVYVSPRFGEDCLLQLNEETDAFIPVPGLSDRSMGEFKIAL